MVSRLKERGEQGLGVADGGRDGGSCGSREVWQFAQLRALAVSTLEIASWRGPQR